MVRRVIIILLFVLWEVSSWAQDSQFSQFYSNYLYLAPSFSGLNLESRVSFNYRDQWPGIANGYKTYSASFDHFFSNLNSGVGVLVYQDVAGTSRLRNTNISLQYSYDISIFRTFHARPGMSISYVNTAFDFERIVWGDQMSASGNAATSDESIPVESVGDIDFGTSVLTYTDKFWVGYSIDHLLKPNQSLYAFDKEEGNEGYIPIKHQVFGGLKYLAKQQLLRPIPTNLQYAFLYKQQKNFSQLDMGLYWYRTPLVLGIWYRGIPLIKSNFNNDAIVMLIGYKTKYLSIGYSYDFTISRLITSTKGAHEISITYSFETQERQKKRGMVPCPQF